MMMTNVRKPQVLIKGGYGVCHKMIKLHALEGEEMQRCKAIWAQGKGIFDRSHFVLVIKDMIEHVITL